jgi:hypothetical protein
MAINPPGERKIKKCLRGGRGNFVDVCGFAPATAFRENACQLATEPVPQRWMTR